MIMMEPTRSRSAAHPRHAADDDDRERLSSVGADGGDDGDRQRNLGQQRRRPEAPPAMGIRGGAPLGSRVPRTLRRILALTRQCARAGTSAAIVRQPNLDASLRKALFCIIGTVAIVVLTACFPQNRIGLLMGLAAHIPWPSFSELATVTSGRFAPTAVGRE
jgi:hypothetical protein